ncbi:MAG TPA: aminopeptidase, partial [Massilia timonae]|nr:aminopeptidase [Massilia timonae]
MYKIVSSLVLTALAGSLALAYPAYAQNVQNVQEAPLRAHLAHLSSDAMEGRGTGQ